MLNVFGRSISTVSMNNMNGTIKYLEEKVSKIADSIGYYHNDPIWLLIRENNGLQGYRIIDKVFNIYKELQALEEYLKVTYVHHPDRRIIEPK